MVFQKKGGAAVKQKLSQKNEKVPKKVFEVEDDDDEDEDDDMEADSDIDDSDSDDSEPANTPGKLNAKGKQTPSQSKGSFLVKTSKKKDETVVLSVGKKNQLASPQAKKNEIQIFEVKGSGKKKLIDKEAVEIDSDEEEEDDDDDDDDTSDSDDGGKLNAKGKQTPTQSKVPMLVKTPKNQAQTLSVSPRRMPTLNKVSTLVKTPKNQAQTLSVSSGKKKQPATSLEKQTKHLPGVTTIAIGGQSADDDSDEDDDDSDEDGSNAGGKLYAGGKQTPTQSKGSSLIITPKGQMQSPAVSSGKKNQIATPVQKQANKRAMMEFPGIKDSGGKGKFAAKKAPAGDDESSEEDDSDDEDDSDEQDDEVEMKSPAVQDKSKGKKTPDGKKDMHVSFELPKKGGVSVDAAKHRQVPATPGAQKGKLAKGAPGKGIMKGKKSAEPDEDDDDIDDEDDLSDDDAEDDDDSDDEDDDDDADSDEEEAIKKKVASLKKQMIPKNEKKLNQSSATSQEVKSKKAKTQLSDPKGEPKENKTVQNKLFQETYEKGLERKQLFQETYEKELERKRERDARNLYVRGMPPDVTVDELKALSPDILDVSLPKSRPGNKGVARNVYGFLEFASEKKAEENYVKLQKKKLRGQELYIDFSGEKSKNKRVADSTSKIEAKNINKMKLFATGLPADATMAEVAQLFPGSYSVTLNKAQEFRNCSAAYHTEEAAAEDIKGNQNAKIRGRAITVLYAIEKKDKQGQGQFKRKRPQHFENKFAPFNKRQKSKMT